MIVIAGANTRRDDDGKNTDRRQPSKRSRPDPHHSAALRRTSLFGSGVNTCPPIAIVVENPESIRSMTRTVVRIISRPRGKEAAIAFGIRARPESVANRQNTLDVSSLNIIELTQSSTSAGNRTRASPDGRAAGPVRRRTSGNVVVTAARGSAPNVSSTDSPPRTTPPQAWAPTPSSASRLPSPRASTERRSQELMIARRHRDVDERRRPLRAEHSLERRGHRCRVRAIGHVVIALDPAASEFFEDGSLRISEIRRLAPHAPRRVGWNGRRGG